MSQPAVFVFIADGCPACHEYLPRFRQQVARLQEHGVPVGIYDLAHDRRGVQLARKLGVAATPTTIVMNSRRALHKRVGAIDNRALAQFLASAR